MKKVNALLLTMPLIILAGCNSSSSKDSSVKVQSAKPVADYTFTNAALVTLMEDREQILESMTINFNGNTYDQMKFAEELDESTTVIQLEDNKSNRLDLLLSSNNDGTCAIYKESEILDFFNCDDSVRSVSGDNTLIQSTTQNSGQPIQVEFNSDAPEYIPSIGSTILTATQNGNRIDIATSFAFKAFYRDLLKMTDADERIHSTLGVTTFLQLSDIVQKYTGSDMTLRFTTHIGGSADDDINMYTGLMIHNHQITTMVTATGSVFSGGTDLFAAGKVRILERADDSVAIEANKQIGVHSWSNGQQSAKEIPYADESHRKQATFFNTVMGDKGIDFYVFTIDSAPFDGEHWVTKADSDKYDFITTIQ